MQKFHEFEESLLPDWWHKSNREGKIIFALILLGLLAFVQEFPHLSAVAVIAMLAILAVAAVIRWSIRQLR